MIELPPDLVAETDQLFAMAADDLGGQLSALRAARIMAPTRTVARAMIVHHLGHAEKEKGTLTVHLAAALERLADSEEDS